MELLSSIPATAEVQHALHQTLLLNNKIVPNKTQETCTQTNKQTNRDINVARTVYDIRYGSGVRTSTPEIDPIGRFKIHTSIYIYY
jgi:hypothetical protein